MLWKSIHLGAAIAFWVGLVLLAAAVPGSCARPLARSTASTEDDGRWLRWAVSRRGPEPPQGRFNAGQKLNTAIVGGLMVVFTVQWDADVPAGDRRPVPRHQRDPGA